MKAITCLRNIFVKNSFSVSFPSPSLPFSLPPSLLSLLKKYLWCLVFMVEAMRTSQKKQNAWAHLLYIISKET